MLKILAHLGKIKKKGIVRRIRMGMGIRMGIRMGMGRRR
jgi:hypothetical protein